MDEGRFGAMRAHLPPTTAGFDWAMSRLASEGLEDVADGYAHALGVFYQEPEPRAAAWTPMRIAVAALLLRYPPAPFVSAAGGALVVDFFLEEVGAEATLRGLWATHGLIARTASLPGFELDSEGAVMVGILKAGGRRSALEQATKAASQALRERLPELALELFERWRLFGAHDDHADVATLLVLLPSDAAADRLGQLVHELRDLPASGDVPAALEEARHRLGYLDLLAAMELDRALGWLGTCAADRRCTPEVRSQAKTLLAKVARRRKTDVAALPRLDAASTAFARLDPEVRRRIDRRLRQALRVTAVELEEIQQATEDDSYEGRDAEITRQWEVLAPELESLLPAELPKRDRAAVGAELRERFTLDCMEASPRWAR